MIIAALFFAFVVDAVFGDPPNRFHPVVLMGHTIQFGKRLNTPQDNRKALFGGLTVLLGGIFLFFSALTLLQTLLLRFQIHYFISVMMIGIVLKGAFSLQGLYKAGKEIDTFLIDGDIQAARRSLAWHLVSRPADTLSAAEISAAAIESIAENLTDSFLSPVFYFAVCGLPGAWAYRFVNTGDAMIGYRTKEYEYFGKPTAIGDSILNWVPARIGGLLIVLAALFCGKSAAQAYKVLRSDHAKTSSVNAGWTMAAMAGALGIRLEKHDTYCLNDNAPLPDREYIMDAIRIVRVASIIWLIIIAGILLGCRTADRWFLFW